MVTRAGFTLQETIFSILNFIHLVRASLRNFPKGGQNDDFMELSGGGGGGGAKFSLVPSPSLIVCREACSTLHTGRKKVLVYPLFAHNVVFHETLGSFHDIFVIINRWDKL